MSEYYEIKRSKECYLDYVVFADKYLIKAFNFYRRFYFISRKKRLRLIKEQAIKQILNLEHNLCSSGWVCLSKSEKNKKIVSEFMIGAVDSIDFVNLIKEKK